MTNNRTSVDFRSIMRVLRVGFEMANNDPKLAESAELLGREFLQVLSDHVEAKQDGMDQKLVTHVLALWFVLGSITQAILESVGNPEVLNKDVH